MGHHHHLQACAGYMQDGHILYCYLMQQAAVLCEHAELYKAGYAHDIGSTSTTPKDDEQQWTTYAETQTNCPANCGKRTKLHVATSQGSLDQA